ncbi:MAG: hypothetical protein HN416_17965 [Nitrospina sp.]|nr:hypothetical protein [Nitrospina sp.]
MELHSDADIAKLKFLGDCWTEVMNRRVAFNVTGKPHKKERKTFAGSLNVNPEDLNGFSRCAETLNKLMDDGEISGWDLFAKQLKKLGDAATPDIDKLRRPFLDPRYRFSDEWNDDFKAEFLAVTYFFIKSDGVDPLIDLALMKISFSFGKIIERLDQDGRRNKDEKSNAGGTQHKGKLPYEEYIQTAKDTAEEFKRLGIKPQKKMVMIALRKLLVEREKEKEEENRKDVHGPDQIKNILKDEWSDIL